MKKVQTIGKDVQEWWTMKSDALIRTGEEVLGLQVHRRKKRLQIMSPGGRVKSYREYLKRKIKQEDNGWNRIG